MGGVRIKGITKLLKQLDEINMSDKELKEPIIEGVTLVQRSAADKVNVKTGNLKGSIRRGIDDEDGSGYVATNVEYAPHQEYGTVNMKGKPFMRPALKENLREIISKFEKFKVNKLRNAAK